MDIQTIVQMVMDLSKKDPKRKDIMRKLKEEEKKAAEDVKKAMASVLVTRRAKLTTESSIEDCISYFDAIRIFLDDFRFGREVVLSSEEAVLGINKVLRFLVKTLNDYSMQLIVQKCFKLAQTVLNFLSHHLIMLMSRAENVTELEENVKYFLLAKHAPIDVTTIAAIVSVQIWNFKEEIWKWNLLFDLSGDLQKIALINGLLSSCSPKFISTSVKPRGFLSLIEVTLDISSGTTKNTLALMAARTVESWFSIFLKNCQASDTDSEQARCCHGNENFSLKPLLGRILMEVLLNTDHSIDAVRYSSKRSLESGVTVYSKLFGKEAVSKLLVQFSQQSPHSSRRRYISIMYAVLLEAEPAWNWIQANADQLIKQSQNPIHGPVAKECLSVSLRWSARDLDKQTFARRWLRPLITDYEMLQSHTLYSLVEQAVKDSNVGFEDVETDKLEVALVFLLVCKRNGIKASKENEICVLRNLLISADHKVRLNCLRLIIASPKTSEHIDRSYLELIQQALHLNFFCQSRDFRHQFIGIMKKLIERLADGPDSSFFIRWLWDICIKFTVSSQSFTRCTVFQILKLLQEQFSRSNGSNAVIELSPGDIQLLMVGINDSYEENQTITLNILSTCVVVEDVTNLVDMIKNDSSNLYEKAFGDIVSIRPPTTLAGTTLLRLLVRKGCYPRDAKRSESPIYIVLQKLVRMLEDQVITGKRGLLEAAATKPFYGTLYAIRSVLLDPWLRDWSTLFGLKSLVIRALELSKEVCTLVMKVISSSSPEGHLLMDLEQVCDSKMIHNLSQEGVSIETHGLEAFPVSSQLLLVCCWRSVREVSLLIGHLTSNLPLGNSGTDLLSADMCLYYGQLLLDTLLDSKHRGAFEQAGVGFTMVCTTFFKSSQPKLCEKPRFWLENMLHELQSGTEVSQYCATRRSAGLPYMVLGILHGELSVSSSILFTQAMTKLLHIIEIGTSLNSKIHAYNILRALYRDTKLAEVVHPFIADGLRLAIIGTRSSLWIERNASTLMFSALMTRVFGVNPADPANRSAGITWKIFFQKYPALYSFLLSEFSTIVKDVDQNLHPSLFPILLLMCRFQPSVAIFESSVLKESAFVPYVMDCASSPVMKIRSLAARVLPGIVDARNLDEILKTLCIKSFENKGMNRLHGILLQIHSVLSLVSLSEDEVAKKYQFFSLWLSKCLCLLNPEIPADVSLIALKILQENIHLLPNNKNNILSRLLALIQDKNSRPSLQVLQSQCVCLCFQIQLQQISEKMQVILDLEAIFRIHFDSTYEVRRSILDNLVCHLKKKLIPSSGVELIRRLSSKLLMEDDDIVLAKGIEALSLSGYIPEHKERENLRLIYSCSFNEELKACITNILGVTSELFCANIDLVFEGIKFANSLVSKKAAMERLESHKTILEELFANDVYKRLWLILMHSLEDDEEVIALTAAQLVTPFLKNMDFLTSEPGGRKERLRVCADSVTTINPYWCIEAIIQFLKTEGRNNSLQILEESGRVADGVEHEEIYFEDEGKVFTKSQSGQQFYFIDYLRKQKGTEQ